LEEKSYQVSNFALTSLWVVGKRGVATAQAYACIGKKIAKLNVLYPSIGSAIDYLAKSGDANVIFSAIPYQYIAIDRYSYV
jgi:hypothetical protein